MDSSDEGFAWTNTSKDDSESEVEMPHNGESESDKSYKKKLQKELFKNGELDSSTEAEPRKKKKHKREKSMSGSPRVKRESPDKGHDYSPAAEHLLHVKVKEERVSFIAPRESPRKRQASTAEPEYEPKKKKKKRNKCDEHESSTTDGPESPRKKRRKRDSEGTSTGDQVIIDKFEAKCDEHESSTTDGPESPRKKRRKRDSEGTSTGDQVIIDKFEAKCDEHESSTTDGPESPRKKRRKRDSKGTSTGDQVIIDKFEAQETVVEQRPKVNGHERNEKIDYVSQKYTSKEFIEDEDSSSDERPAPPPVASSARPRARASDANMVSPRKGRISERITFESQSESELERSPNILEKSHEPQSPKRAKKSKRQSESERPQKSYKSTFERPEQAGRASESQSDSEPARKSPERISLGHKHGSPKKARKASERQVNGEAHSIPERITLESQSDLELDDPPARSPAGLAHSIPERITFEASDLEPDALSPRTPVGGGGARLGRYLRLHAHMQPVLGPLPPAAAVTADDDVWLVHCPRDVQASALAGVTLSLDARSKLKAGGRAFELAPAAGGDRVVILGPATRGQGFCVRVFPLRGSLRLRARLPRPRAPAADALASPDRVPMPITRPRHPLLGANYEQAAALPPAVQRRLAAAATATADEIDAPDPDASERRVKKKKRKHADQEPQVEPKTDPELVLETDEPKKRKRKHSSRQEPDSQREPDSPPRKKKVKKEKKRRDDAAVWDSEQAIEESLFNF